MRLVHFTQPPGGPTRSNRCLLLNLLRWTHLFRGAMTDLVKIPSTTPGRMIQIIDRRGI